MSLCIGITVQAVQGTLELETAIDAHSWCLPLTSRELRHWLNKRMSIASLLAMCFFLTQRMPCFYQVLDYKP